MTPWRCRASASLMIWLALGVPPASFAQQHAPKKKPSSPAAVAAPAPPPPAPATPSPPPDSRPYDPQLIRLAEILGALSYLGQLCGEKDAETWRARMQALLDAEGSPEIRKERLAGAYNRGIQGYGLSYRACTPNARIVIERFLAEGARIAKDVENRYRAS